VEEARALTNRLAPEHLTVDAGADLRWVKNAGSVFIGHHTPQSMGDYISGPNHVLPTGRNGRVRGGLSVLDFVKIITVQQYTLDALREVGPHTIALAEAEGLTGHAESVRVRCDKHPRICGLARCKFGCMALLGRSRRAQAMPTELATLPSSRAPPCWRCRSIIRRWPAAMRCAWTSTRTPSRPARACLRSCSS
jgi:hypothetical protein